MAKQVLNNGETGLVIRNKINSNFTELYNDIDALPDANTNIAEGTRTSTTVQINSSTGTNATLNAATTTEAGVMASADKLKLDGIEAGAEVNTVTSVASKTGNVTLDKNDVGLNNVDNVQQAPLTHVGDTGNAHGLVTNLVNGFMSSTDKTKLDNVEANANNYEHPATHSLDIITETDTKKIMTNDERTKLSGIETGAQVNVDQNASEVPYNNTQSDLTANNVQDAIDELDAKVESGGNITASQVSLNTADFTGNLNNTIDDVQKLADAVDVLVAGGEGGGSTNISEGTRTSTTVQINSSTGTNATLNQATTTLAGVMASADKIKLDGIEAGAEVNILTSADKTKLDGIEEGAQVNSVLSVASKTGNVTLDKTDVGLNNVDNIQQAPISHVGSNGDAHSVVTTDINGFMSSIDKLKLDGIEADANNYVHPATHPIDMIVEDTNLKIMTTAERTKLAGIETGAEVNVVTSVASKTGSVELVKADVGLNNVDNVQQAPLTHVGSNGDAHSVVTTDINGFMSSVDKTKLDGVETNANNYSHPATHSLDIITETDTKKIMTNDERTKLSGIETGAQVNVGTNISQGTRTTTTVPITSSTGTNATLSQATTSLAGVMSSADKTKLNGIEEGAEVNLAPEVVETSQKTTDYTLSLEDSFKIVLMNKNSDATVTIPNNSTTAFPIGTLIGIYNISTHGVTVEGEGGVIVRGAGNFGQYVEVSLRKRATNEWVLVGDVS